ncbi:hypothetical protein ACFGVS_12625 [Mucilaginibacter sp. AW1-7]|uniref:hypothetical protein n=1 Tax=Mucilaginibacter sp. AW1-7 TaxID=3349874 RepID=UPI003F73E421
MYEKILESFNKQGLMQTFNAKLALVENGRTEITCDFSAGLTQQHGFSCRSDDKYR